MFLLLLVLASTPASAGSVVTISCMSVVPWGDEQTQQGASCSFMDYVAREVGLTVKADVRPLARILEDLRNGTVELTMMVPLPERLEYAVSICEPTRVTLAVAYFKNAGLSSTTDMKVGVLRHSGVLDSFFDGGGQPVEIKDQTQGFMMLAAGRLDATFCGQPGCDSAIHRAGLDREDLSFTPIHDFPFGVLLSKKSPLAQDHELLARLRAACLTVQAVERLRVLIDQNE